jgi:hypothetical protein
VCDFHTTRVFKWNLSAERLSSLLTVALSTPVEHVFPKDHVSHLNTSVQAEIAVQELSQI